MKWEESNGLRWFCLIGLCSSSIWSSLYECMKSIPSFYCLFGLRGLCLDMQVGMYVVRVRDEVEMEKRSCVYIERFYVQIVETPTEEDITSAKSSNHKAEYVKVMMYPIETTKSGEGNKQKKRVSIILTPMPYIQTIFADKVCHPDLRTSRCGSEHQPAQSGPGHAPSNH